MRTSAEAKAAHKIRWFARFPGTDQDWMPRQASWRGAWPWDVRCSCGLETRTGGAVRSHIENLIWMHREFGDDTGWRPVATAALEAMS